MQTPRAPRAPLAPLEPRPPMEPLQPLKPLSPAGSKPAYLPPVVNEPEPEPPREWPPPSSPPTTWQPPEPPSPQLIRQFPSRTAAGRIPLRVARPPGGNKAAGLVGLVVVLVVGLAVIGSRSSSGGGQPVVASIPPISTGSIGSLESGSAAATTVARIGQSRTLAGTVGGQRVRVTLTRWVNNATSSDSLLGPGPGKRYVAAQFRITNTGSVAYIDSPSNGAAVIDGKGHKYRAAFVVSGIRQGAVFNPAVSLAAGTSTRGFVVFEVSRHAVIHEVEFSEDSGLGQTGKWSVRK